MQVPGLLQEYKGCLATRKFDEAEKINKEINYFITNEINTTGLELWRFAHDLLRKAYRCEESVPVYFAAASLFKKEGDLEMMRYCVEGVGLWKGMHGANMGMIARDVTMKDVVKRHVIPLMRDIKNQMLEMTSVSEDKCRFMSEVLRCIAESEELVDDDVAAMVAREESRVWELERWRLRRELEEESESSEVEEEPGTYLMQ